MKYDDMDRAKQVYRSACLLRRQFEASFERTPTTEWGRLLAASKKTEAAARAYLQEAEHTQVRQPGH